MRTDVELLQAAIDKSGLSARRFASDVLDVNERAVRYWLSGREQPWTVVVVCWLVVRLPKFARVIAQLRARRRPRPSDTT